VATLSGCDLGSSSSAPAARASQGSAASSASSVAPDPDQAILTAAHTELSDLIVRLGAGTHTRPLVAVHRVQLAALQGEQPPVTTRARPLTPPLLVARESRAVVRFTRWAEAAQSGDLARVLASIAAGIRVQPVLRDAS
jgi:hypothetical protein